MDRRDPAASVQLPPQGWGGGGGVRHKILRGRVGLGGRRYLGEVMCCDML